MMIGHTGVNYALRFLPAYVANLALLGEPIGATLLAWWLPGIRERPTVQLLVGGSLVLLGIAMGTTRRVQGNRADPIRHGQPGTDGPGSGRTLDEGRGRRGTANGRSGG
jgi:hypothetical protein